MIIQYTRRFIQVLVVLFLLLVPALSRFTNYLASRDLDKSIKKWQGSVQSLVLKSIDTTLRSLPNGEKDRADERVRNRPQVLIYAQKLRGGVWSGKIGSLSFVDPLAVFESSIAQKTTTKILLLGFLAPLILTLIFGRIFCSWICPVGFFLELTDKLRRVVKFFEINPWDIKLSRNSKFILLGIGLFLSFLIGIPVLGYIYPPAIISRELHDFVFGIFDRAEMGKFDFWLGGLTWMSLIIVAIMFLEIFVSQRFWCRYLCPGGALYSLLGRFRIFKVKHKKDHCTQCKTCNTVCQMGLKPMQNQMGQECDNCGICISNCPSGALSYSVSCLKK